MSTVNVTVLDFGSGEGTDEIAAELSTDHAASSYGQPVLVIAGEAYGVADLVRLPSGPVPAGKLKLRYPDSLEEAGQATLIRLWERAKGLLS